MWYKNEQIEKDEFGTGKIADTKHHVIKTKIISTQALGATVIEHPARTREKFERETGGVEDIRGAEKGERRVVEDIGDGENRSKRGQTKIRRRTHETETKREETNEELIRKDGTV